MGDNPYRGLPSVHDVLQSPALQQHTEGSHEMLVAAIRDELGELRGLLARGEKIDGDLEAIAARALARAERASAPGLRLVINATGIVLHTNLGRAPMAEQAAQAAYQAARGYLNLELDLDTGKRSSRQDPIRAWVCRLTGAESATAVNNNAAATVIALRALARDREVIVSRGQLIEIGGSFRIPEIMAVSGATLREVGTTNITRSEDFQRAISVDTAALMQIHPSNYRIAGFTESVPLADLVQLARKYRLKVIDDVGSGALVDFGRFGLTGEPLARESIAAGADVVLFSGDKLLGGPQAGILAGKAEIIAAIEKDPLMRAFRLDKMTLAALESTLRLYVQEDVALRDVPVLHMLGVPPGVLHERARGLAERLRSITGLASVAVEEDVAYVGGGSLPDQQLPSWVVALAPAAMSEVDLAQRLRLGQPAVMGRVRDGKVVLDVRTVFPEQLDAVVDCVRAAFTMQ